MAKNNSFTGKFAYLLHAWSLRKKHFKELKLTVYLFEVGKKIRYVAANFERLQPEEQCVISYWFRQIIIIYPLSFNNCLEVRVKSSRWECYRWNRFFEVFINSLKKSMYMKQNVCLFLPRFYVRRYIFSRRVPLCWSFELTKIQIWANCILEFTLLNLFHLPYENICKRVEF